MKNYAQVYVEHSIEAAKTYCAAFGAEITFEIKNSSGTAYEHCELSVGGESFLAICEAIHPCDVPFLRRTNWETMTFNVCEMGSEQSVQRAFDVLREGGAVIEPIHEVPWSKCCATILDRYGVRWWISL